MMKSQSKPIMAATFPELQNQMAKIRLLQFSSFGALRLFYNVAPHIIFFQPIWSFTVTAIIRKTAGFDENGGETI